VLVFAGYRVWQDTDVDAYPVAFAGALLCITFGLGLAFYASLGGVAPARKENAAVTGLVVAFLTYAATFMFLHGTRYGSDALLFDAYSARLAAGGHNPYAHSMQQAFSFFGASRSLVTPTASGGEILAQSYPALAFLIYVPAMALGLSALWVDIAAHAALIAILAWVAPRPLKALAPLVLFVDPSYTDYTLGSVTDIVWVVPVALCARYWNSKPVVAAAFLGAACAVKQQPWFIVPFALVAWILDAYDRRQPRRLWAPATALALAFLIPNTTFIATDARGWLTGIVTPLRGDLLAFGSGVLQLATANAFVADPHLLSMLSTFSLAVLLAVYTFYRKQFGFLPFVASAVALFFAPRELQNYFMYLPVPLIVYHFSPRLVALESARPRARWGVSPVAIGLLAVALAGVLVVWESTNPVRAVSVSVLRSEYDPATGNVDALVVRAQNNDRTTHAVRFGVQTQGKGDDFSFWLRSPESIAAHGARTLRVSAPNYRTQLRPGGQTAQVVAVDAKSGIQAYSDPREVRAPFGGLMNPRLSAWEKGPPQAPTSWTYAASDPSTAFVKRAGHSDVLSFAITPPAAPADGDWRFATLSQALPGTPLHVTLRILPESDYHGGAHPRTFFGLRLTDALGHNAYYAIDSGLHEPAIRGDGMDTVFVLPGRLHGWNAVEIAPEQLKAARFAWADTKPIVVSVVALAHRGDAPVRGEFGGATGE
jgi:uncharacterized membrane protein